MVTKKTKSTITILAIGFFAIMLVSMTLGIDVLPSQGKKVVCDVSVKNPLLRDVEFTSIQCNVVDDCVGFQELTLFGLLSDKGQIKLCEGSSCSSKSYDITESTTDQFTLKKCVDMSTDLVEIQLFNDEEGKIESQSWNV